MSLFGGSPATTSSSSKPWRPIRNDLRGAYNDLNNTYRQGAPNYYPGQTLAPMSGYTRGALNSMAMRARNGSPVTDAAQSQLTKTLNGGYLNGNKYLNGAINAATRPVTTAYQDIVAPGLDSTFAAAGRTGGGAHALAASDAANQMATQVGDIGRQMSYQNYADERQNQMRGMLFAPEMANQDYRDIGMLGQAGAGIDAYNQNKINANMNRFNYNQNKDFNYTSDYLGILNGTPYGMSRGTSTPAGSNMFTSGIGGALAGAQIGSMVPGVGTGLGALGGGALGLLGSFF